MALALAGPPRELRLLLTRISEAEMELYYQLLQAAALAEALAAGESRSPQRFRPGSGSCNAASGCRGPEGRLPEAIPLSQLLEGDLTQGSRFSDSEFNNTP
uniref:Uncharacterized protein n=1 Tax=Sphaerodactylus townsendi TaxID=933632 RepID=A0ACB8FYX9_9SAUR